MFESWPFAGKLPEIPEREREREREPRDSLSSLSMALGGKLQNSGNDAILAAVSRLCWSILDPLVFCFFLEGGGGKFVFFKGGFLARASKENLSIDINFSIFE